MGCQGKGASSFSMGCQGKGALLHCPWVVRVKGHYYIVHGVVRVKEHYYIVHGAIRERDISVHGDKGALLPCP